MKILILLLLLKIDPNPEAAATIDTFDCIEVNHKLNHWGVETLAQVITWDWHKNDRRFHVEWWRGMSDAYTKTKEGEEKWNKKRREIADAIKDWPTRKRFLNESYYRGEFSGGSLYPVKNRRTGYYEIKIKDKYGSIERVIRSKSFIESRSNDDPEKNDRIAHPPRTRRGLTNNNEMLLLHIPELGLIKMIN